jgi:uncharacterized membrane protein
MDWQIVHSILVFVQRCVSTAGILIIISGIVYALSQYLYFLGTGSLTKHNDHLNIIRLNLGRVLILGLEFIVAADLIGSTTTPDYYSVGLLAVIVVIRTLLSFSLNRELMSLSKR